MFPIGTGEYEMKNKNMTTKARYFAIGLIALEIASIPVSAQIIDKYAFTKPQKVAAVPFPAEVGITKFLVSSDAPFAIISENAIGEFDVRVKVSGILNGQRFGQNAQLPGAAASCSAQTSKNATKIYEAKRKTASRDGDVLTQAVIVEVRYFPSINPKLRVISQNEAKDFVSGTACTARLS